MINKPPSFKDLNIRIPIIIPIKGRGFINHGSGLVATKGIDSMGIIFSYPLLRTAQSGVNARQKEALSQITHACQCFLHLAPTGTRAKHPEIFARVPTLSGNSAFCAD